LSAAGGDRMAYPPLTLATLAIFLARPSRQGLSNGALYDMKR